MTPQTEFLKQAYDDGYCTCQYAGFCFADCVRAGADSAINQSDKQRDRRGIDKHGDSYL